MSGIHNLFQLDTSSHPLLPLFSNSVVMTNKKKWKGLSLREKVGAITMLNIRFSGIAIMNKYGFKWRTVTKLKSEGNVILKRTEQESAVLHTKYARAVKFPEIEEQMLQFI